ncbi:hypothetical protein AX17_004030 [Amanita inopinata Kibby_2008]|nr:hypothetical protein AX17_004030 [Amanita inopinata Kibby_2008]
MRFFKSFRSLHNRTKSDPIATSTNLPLHPNLAVIDKAYNDIFAPTNLSLDSSCCNNISLEHVNLRRLSSTWALSHSRLVYDLNLIQSELLLERDKNICLHRQVEMQSALIKNLERSLAHHDKLTSILDEIGLCDDVIKKAHRLVLEGQSAPDAIRHATSPLGSKWSSSTSTISGLRTYIAALHISLSLRKELRVLKKVAKFWKKIAQEHQRHSEIVTPSVSTLSSVCEKLSPERQTAVNALIARRAEERRNAPFHRLPVGSSSSIALSQANITRRFDVIFLDSLPEPDQPLIQAAELESYLANTQDFTPSTEEQESTLTVISESQTGRGLTSHLPISLQNCGLLEATYKEPYQQSEPCAPPAGPAKGLTMAIESNAQRDTLR